MTCDDERTRHQYLAWSHALDYAVRAVERQRGLPPGSLSADEQDAVSAALAAGLAEFAEHAESDGLTWADAIHVARHESEETDRCRTARMYT